MKDATVILASFSPVDAELPKKHFRSTLDFVLNDNVEVCTAQVVSEGQEPLDTTGASTSLVFESNDKIFFKECLWNLAAAHATTDNFIFIDADLHYHDTDWLAQITNALSEYDIIQPFDLCNWEFRDGLVNPTMQKSAWFNVFRTGSVPLTSTYHPGFGFAMTRSHFDAINGFYEHGVMGEGDHMCCVAHTPEKQVHYILQLSKDAVSNPDCPLSPDHRSHWTNLANHFLSPDFIEYRANIQSLDFKAGVPAGLAVYHRWHGQLNKRQYTTRLKYLNWPENGRPAFKRSDGLLEWTAPQPEVDNWWLTRDDDGVNPDVITANKYAPK